MVGIRKVGSTAATQGAVKSKEQRGLGSSGFVGGTGKTFTEKRQFGGVKRKK